MSDYVPFGDEWKAEVMRLKKSEIIDMLAKALRENVSRPTQDAQDGATVCPECDGAVEFCAMGHYVPAKSTPPVI